MIEAAFELSLSDIEVEIAKRWSILLLWFTAAANRRVKDWATRALVALFVYQPQIIPGILTRFLDCDDDAVRERALLSCYGALILTRDAEIARESANNTFCAFQVNPAAFNNALIRDHIRCIGELAEQLGALPEGCKPELITTQPIPSEWPLEIPSDEQVKEWSEIVHFWPDEFVSDFSNTQWNTFGHGNTLCPNPIWGNGFFGESPEILTM